ncbi:hypothetical protein EBS_0751 [endosymbiont of unidentified scaly snail isolate Monju]|nr:hypothetical protein EBS_0751 [endosymbiont of unidentified scaly snail isolate Monju]
MAPRRSGPAGELVAPLQGDLAKAGDLLEHPLGLADDLLTDGSDTDVTLAPLEQAHAQLFLEFAHRHAERRLADVTSLGRSSKVTFASHGDDVTELIERHASPLDPDLRPPEQSGTSNVSGALDMTGASPSQRKSEIQGQVCPSGGNLLTLPANAGLLARKLWATIT